MSVLHIQLVVEAVLDTMIIQLFTALTVEEYQFEIQRNKNKTG